MTETDTPEVTPLTPRIEGLDLVTTGRLLAHLDLELARDTGELGYPFAFMYAHRAQMRFAAGFPATSVLDDFWQAARVLVVNAGTHLNRFPPEQLLTRRILPVEFGLLGGQVSVAQRVANGYGLPLITARANLGGHALATEMRVISPGLLGERITHPQHLIGVAAGVYAATLASAIRGYDDEITIALNVLAAADFDGELAPGYKAAMLRYAGLCEALLELVQPGQRNFAAIIADQIDRYTSQLAHRLGDQYLHPTSPQRYIDTSSVAVFALALLSNYPVEAIPLTPATAFYRDLLDAMSQPREFDQVEPHEAMRAAYEAAGITVEPPTRPPQGDAEGASEGNAEATADDVSSESP